MPALTGGAALVGATLVDPVSGGTARGLLRVDSGDDIAIVDPSIIAATGAQALSADEVEGVFGTPQAVPAYTLDVSLDTGGTIEGVTVLGSPTTQLGYGGLLGVNELANAVLLYQGAKVSPPAGWFDLTIPGAAAAAQPASDWLWVFLGVAAAGLAAVLAGALS